MVIPKALRKEMIKDLHTAHQGIESTLRRAQESIYWPNMNSEVKDYISRCEICLTYTPHQQKEPLLSHEVPDRPWAKIATDLFQFENKDYLVTVDYFSNFFEVDRMYSTTSQAVIKVTESSRRTPVHTTPNPMGRLNRQSSRRRRP